MNKKGQVGFTPFLVLGGLLLLGMGVLVFAILSPVLTEFIDFGVSSVENSDNGTATSFFINLLPMFVVLLLVGSAIYIISTGGGHY